MTRKNAFFEEWSWLKFNNLGLALGTNLRFYTSLSKGLKLKVRKFWGLIPTFVEVTGEKPVGGIFASPSLIGLREAIIFGPKMVQKRFFTEKPFLMGKYTFHVPLHPFQGAKNDRDPKFTLGQSNQR